MGSVRAERRLRFEEGTCATTHALGPFCIDDRLGGRPGRLDERYEFWKWTLNNCGCQTSRGYTLGPCGLCALPRLERLGVASLKVVGREAPLARKLASVRLATVALGLAASGARPGSIRDAVVALRGAPELCATRTSATTPMSGPTARQAASGQARRPDGAEPFTCAPAAPTKRVVPIHAKRHAAHRHAERIVLTMLRRYTPHLSGGAARWPSSSRWALAARRSRCRRRCSARLSSTPSRARGDFAAIP